MRVLGKVVVPVCSKSVSRAHASVTKACAWSLYLRSTATRGPHGSQGQLRTRCSARTNARIPTTAITTDHPMCHHESAWSLPKIRSPIFHTPTTAMSTIRSPRSEEHTSELQSLRHLVCRL